MSGFRGFSEAARLYAANVPVVEAMRALTAAEVGQFRESLRAAVQGRVEPLRLHGTDVREEGDNWHDWVATGPDEDARALWRDRTVPWVAYKASPAVLILARQIVCYVPGAPYLKVSEGQMHRIAALADDPDLKRYGVERSSEDWVLLEVKVAVDSDPVGKLVPVLADLLRKLDQIRRL
jgi:hypothetical protein